MVSVTARGAERGLWLWPPGAVAQRADLATFVERAMRLDGAAVIRLRTRADGLVTAWSATAFGVLACRGVGGAVRPADLSVAAEGLARGLSAMDTAGYVDPGFSMDSAWRGALPPESGFAHVDDVPARVILELAERGALLVKEFSGSHGPPVSLLDQEVIRVGPADASEHVSEDVSVGLPMRCVLALTAMGFLPRRADVTLAEEVVRVRVMPNWLRIDARFGSVYRRRGDPALVLR